MPIYLFAELQGLGPHICGERYNEVFLCVLTCSTGAPYWRTASQHTYVKAPNFR